MPRPKALIVRGEYLPCEQIQQISLSSGSVPLTATIRMLDSTEYQYVGEEAEAVRGQSDGLVVVTTARSPE
jgi:hypothetical protein